MNLFDKPYYPLAHFNYEIFVKCPKCQGRAIITSKEDECKHQNSKLKCLECSYMATDTWFGYYQGYIGYNSYKGISCGHCGTRIHQEMCLTKKTYDRTTVKCPNCQKEKVYPIYWEKHRGSYATDPFLGLDLYYQKNIKNEVLWIYNLEHLRYLKDYLSATIRKTERLYLQSMVARLPNFITSKKNKTTILKQLNKFEDDFLLKTNIN